MKLQERGCLVGGGLVGRGGMDDVALHDERVSLIHDCVMPSELVSLFARLG